MDYSKVKDFPNLQRHNGTKAIVNTDSSGYAEYMQKRQSQLEEKQKIHQLEEDFLIESLDEKKTVFDCLNKIVNFLKKI